MPFLIGLSLLLPPMAFATEISAVPEKQTFGPNDWIKIFLKIDGYSGGQINWNATKPDGASESGFFTNIQASKVTHTINRNAFDNQFGTWKINYQYHDVVKTVDVEVEPLVISVTTDKISYFPGDVATVEFSTNYFEPSAANAQIVSIEIIDEDGNPAKLIDDKEIKVYQPIITQKFSIDELLKYNSYGKYHAVVKYY